MKKIIFSLILIIIIIVAFVGYQYSQYQIKTREQQKINEEYKSYYEKEVLGTTFISILNKTIDFNEKNENNRIAIQIRFKESEQLYSMEQIAKQGSENFVKNYAGMSFKCTKIEHDAKTKIVNYLRFEEI